MELDKVKMKWYVLQAFSGFENKVKQTLEDTIKREGLEKSFGEILVPTESLEPSRKPYFKQICHIVFMVAYAFLNALK